MTKQKLLDAIASTLKSLSSFIAKGANPERYKDIKALLDKLEGVLEEVSPHPAYDKDPKELPMNQPVLTAGVDLKGHSPAWCGGTMAERKEMYALAKKICAEEKLYPSMTLALLATVHGESGFNRWCINLKTLDYGVAQFSKKYYLVEYKMTPQEAIDNPERCLRVMAKNFKAGRASNWVAYKTRNVNALKQYA